MPAVINSLRENQGPRKTQLNDLISAKPSSEAGLNSNSPIVDPSVPIHMSFKDALIPPPPPLCDESENPSSMVAVRKGDYISVKIDEGTIFVCIVEIRTTSSFL